MAAGRALYAIRAASHPPRAPPPSQWRLMSYRPCPVSEPCRITRAAYTAALMMASHGLVPMPCTYAVPPHTRQVRRGERDGVVWAAAHALYASRAASHASHAPRALLPSSWRHMGRRPYCVRKPCRVTCATCAAILVVASGGPLPALPTRAVTRLALRVHRHPHDGVALPAQWLACVLHASLECGCCVCRRGRGRFRRRGARCRVR